MGLYIAASLLIRPNQVVIAGTPGYARANSTFELAGARMSLIPMDEMGIDMDRVEKICKTKPVRMVYVIPHFHHPTLATLSSERRLHLLELATRYKFAIIEDDYDYDFHYAGKPMMPMASLDRNGNVIYIGALSKSLAPAIRVGFMVAPQRFIRSATSLRKAIDTQGDSLIENAIADLYKDGTVGRHIKKSVKLYKERRDHFCDLVQRELRDRVSFKVPEGGMAVWADFQDNDLPTVVQRAYRNGLIMSDGTDYDTGKLKYNSKGMGFASLDFREQERAVAILKKSIN
jgi:GntR family transcriptional regulator/MocR family aminotransferase